MRTACALCLALWAAAGAIAAAQPPSQPAQTFRAGVEAVEIDLRVLDEAGRTVPGLTKDDVEVYEDGVRQEVRILTPVTVPVVPRPRPFRYEPDTQSNRVPFDGRVYVFVLDDLHTNPLRGNRVKAVVRRFMDRYFAANDRAAVVVTSGHGDATQELTGSPGAILRAVDRFSGRALRSAVWERVDQYFRLRNIQELDQSQDPRGPNVTDPNEAERAFQARQALTTLRDVTRWLESVPARRKALIFISEGIEYDLTNLVDNRFASGLVADVRDAVLGAQRSNTTIYSVDPRGLGGIDDELIETSSLPDDTANLGPGMFAQALRVMQNNLSIFSEQTGGFALLRTNDLDGGFERLVRENSEYYVLGYESTNPRHDGRFRRVDVRVTRPGLRVVSRRGYFGRKDAPPGKAGTPAPLRALVESPIPVTGLPIESQVVPLRGTDGKSTTFVTVDLGPSIGFVQDQNVHKGRVDLAIVAIDKLGKIVAKEDRGMSLNFRPATRQAADTYGLRTTARLQLKPGHYQIRIAAHDRTTGRGGSVLHDLDVPDYAKERLTVSPIVLSSVYRNLAAPAHVDAELKEAVGLTPTAARSFGRTDEVHIFAELYDNRKADEEAEAVRVVTTVAGVNGQVAFRAEETVEGFAFDPVRRTYRHRATIPLEDLAPGDYVVTVEARPRRAGAAGVTRDVLFTVNG